MIPSQLKRLQKTRRSVLTTMGLILLTVSSGLAVTVYPWDMLVAHGVSLPRMLLAIAPVAALLVATILFLSDTARRTVAQEAAESDVFEGLVGGSPVDLRAALEGALEMTPERGARFVCEWGERTPAVEGDPARTELAFVCLFACFADSATPETPVRVLADGVGDGCARVSIGPADPDPAALAAALGKALALIRVFGARGSVEQGDGGVRVVIEFPASGHPYSPAQPTSTPTNRHVT